VTALASFLAAVVLSGLAQQAGEGAPDLTDLERALRSTAGQSFGSEESPRSPHEMILQMDTRTIPDDLLLAVLLSGATGNQDPVDVSRKLLSEAMLDVTRLREPSLWSRTKGVGAAGRARVVAAMELSRRIDARDSFSKRRAITSPQEAVDFFRSMSFGPYEILAAIYLDRRRRVIGARTLTIGSSAFTIVDPQQIFREAVELGANSLILAHNHPTGDPTPSPQDRDVTHRVSRAGQVLGISLLDHFVLGAQGKWVSFASEGILPNWAPESSAIWTAER
jgi:DNA repair protein RadC